MEKPVYSLEFEKPLRDLTRRLEELRQHALETKHDVSGQVAGIEKDLAAAQKKVYGHLTPWQRVQIARHPKRPYALDYIGTIFEGFEELHGDRQFMDDRALIGGPAYLDGAAVIIVAQQKGRDTKEKIARNFGMPQPEGYRKALRLARMAEKFGLPLFCFIDTPGAFPGIGSEERHVSEAIAVNLREFAMLRTPSISIVIGEGGSGGALGIGVTDRVLILENSYYSVISPEGCAAILWKDAKAMEKAAEALKLSAETLQSLGVVDEVVAEPLGGAHNDPKKTAATLKYSLQKQLNDLRGMNTESLLEARYQRFRKLGVIQETAKV